MCCENNDAALKANVANIGTEDDGASGAIDKTRQLLTTQSSRSQICCNEHVACDCPPPGYQYN